MSKPVKHLTWGQEEQKHVSFQDVNGLPVSLTFAVYKTLCKRLNDNSELPPRRPPRERPVGVCKLCWKQFLKDEGS